MLGLSLRNTATVTRKKLVIFVGASNCYGVGSSDTIAHGTVQGTQYASRCIDLLDARSEWSAANYGGSGLKASTQLTLFNDNDTFKSLVTKDTIVVIELGGNDLSDNGSAAALQSDLQAFAQAIKNLGGAVVACPILSRTGGFSGGQTQGGFDTARNTVNAWMTTNPVFNAIVSTNSNLHDNTAASNTSFFVDTIHLTDLGHWTYGAAIAEAIRKVAKPKIASWQNGLVSWYPLTGPSNGFWQDVASGIHLSAVGTVSVSTDGRSGKNCASLPGANTDYLRSGATADPRQKTYTGTLAGWVKGSSVSYGHLFGTGSGAGIYNSNAGGGTGLMDWAVFQPGAVFTAINGNWNHVAVRFELRNGSTGGPTQRCQNFLNGVPTGALYTTTCSGFQPFCVGSRMGANAAAILASDLMLWNRLLSNDEIATVYGLG